MRPLVDPDWLAEHHGEVNTVHVATTMAGGDPLAGFHDKRVAGAVTVLLDGALLVGARNSVVRRRPAETLDPQPAASVIQSDRVRRGLRVVIPPPTLEQVFDHRYGGSGWRRWRSSGARSTSCALC